MAGRSVVLGLAVQGESSKRQDREHERSARVMATGIMEGLVCQLKAFDVIWKVGGIHSDNVTQKCGMIRFVFQKKLTAL